MQRATGGNQTRTPRTIKNGPIEVSFGDISQAFELVDDLPFDVGLVDAPLFVVAGKWGNAIVVPKFIVV